MALKLQEEEDSGRRMVGGGWWEDEDVGAASVAKRFGQVRGETRG
jgi:hypothetical protein